MAVAHVATGAAAVTATNNTATSITINAPAGMANGHYLLAFVTFQAAGSNLDATVTPPTGWTLIAGGNDLGASTSTRLNVYGKVAASEGASWTWNYTAPSGGNAAGFVSAFSGVDTTTPVASGEAAYLGQVAATAARPTASLTIAAGRRLIASWSDRGGSTWTVTGTQLQTARGTGSVSVTAEDAGDQVAGSYTRTATASTASSVGSSVILGLNPATASAQAGAVSLSGAGSLTFTRSRSTALVDSFIAAEPFYVAHRGGSVDYVEMTMAAYDASIAHGAKAVEASCYRSSDGVWVLSHDPTTGRMFGTDLTINATSWSTLSALRTTNGNHPMIRLTDLLDKYGSQVIMFVDNKPTTNMTGFLDLIDSYAGPERYVFKNYYTAGAHAVTARARGYRSWGYYYETDLSQLDTTFADWDYLGMEHSASQGAWTTIKAKGKPVLGHVINSATQAATAFSKGADGIMTGKVVGVIPVTSATEDSLDLSGSGSLSLSGSPAPRGSVTLAGSGALVFSGIPRPSGALSLAGSGGLSLSGSGSSAGEGFFGLTGFGALTFSGTAGARGSVSLSGGGTLVVAGSGAQEGDGVPVQVPSLTLAAHSSGLALTSHASHLELT